MEHALPKQRQTDSSKIATLDLPELYNCVHCGLCLNHEYIGEAYLMKGDLKSAEKHLKALREICSLTCEELTDLEREIANHAKKSPVKGSR